MRDGWEVEGKGTDRGRGEGKDEETGRMKRREEEGMGG